MRLHNKKKNCKINYNHKYLQIVRCKRRCNHIMYTFVLHFWNKQRKIKNIIEICFNKSLPTIICRNLRNHIAKDDRVKR